MEKEEKYLSLPAYPVLQFSAADFQLAKSTKKLREQKNLEKYSLWNKIRAGEGREGVCRKLTDTPLSNDVI